MAGLGVALAAFLVLGATGLTDGGAGAALLIFLQYSSQLGGGFLAGRLSGRARAMHGGLAGILMAAIGTAIGLGFSGSGSNIWLVVLALVIAATAGSAGGVLAEFTLRA